MEARLEPKNCAYAEVHERSGGAVSVALHGCLSVQSTAECWRMLQKDLDRRHVTQLDVDVSEVTFQGSICITLVRFLGAGGMTPGAKVNLRGLSEEQHKLMEMLTSEELATRKPPPPLKVRVPEEVGAAVKSFIYDLRDQVAFVGGLAAALPAALVRPRIMRWREVRRVIEKAGADALPVISIFSWLVGVVMALEVVHPLRQLGAEIFIADMIGFSSLRDTGPLVTAIMLAGRSGSAFAAELSTMKVNQELDALTTMGLDPMRFLVLQRVVAALVLTPSSAKQTNLRRRTLKKFPGTPMNCSPACKPPSPRSIKRL